MYESPFSTRYGGGVMRKIWSEIEKRRHWRMVWVAYARARQLANINTISAHQDHIDLQAAWEMEQETQHDLVAELQVYADQCGMDSGELHGEMTSSDVQDNAEVLRQQVSVGILILQLRYLLTLLARAIQDTALLQVMGRTHLQKARPTTIGYRLATAGMTLLESHVGIEVTGSLLLGKGIKGPVGTRAGITRHVEEETMNYLGLGARNVGGQTYDRVQDYRLLSEMAALAAGLSKLATDVRLMKAFGEIYGHKAVGQVGSSAMPEKTNPIREEKVCSLARLVIGNASTAWHNAANNMLERTLDDSANRRIIIPETFLIMDEMISTTVRYVEDMDYEVRFEPYGDVGDAPDRALSVAEAMIDVG